MKRLRTSLICVAGLLLGTVANASVSFGGTAKQYGAYPAFKEFSVSSFHAKSSASNFALYGKASVRDFHRSRVQNLPTKEVGSVIEPSTWAMLLIGAGLIALKLRSHQPRKLSLRSVGAM